MKKLSFRAKILTMIIPLLMLGFFLGAFLLHQLYEDKSNAEAVTASAVSQSELSAFIHEFQRERGMSALFLNKKLTQDDLSKQQKKVDVSLTTFRDSLTAINFKGKDEEIQKFIEMLDEVRDEVSKASDPEKVFQLFGSLITHSIQLQVKLFEQAKYQGIESNFTNLTIFEESKENMGRLRARLNATFAGNVIRSVSDRDAYANYLSGIISNLESPALKISPAGRNKVYDVLGSSQWKEVQNAFRVFSDKYSSGEYGVEVKVFFENITSRIDAVYEIIKGEQSLNLNVLSDVSSSARNKFMALAALLVILLCSVTAFAIYTLKELVGNFTYVSAKLDEASRNVSSASGEIASSSEELSQAATEQASSLEETAASIEEMNSMVQKNAENALRTSELAVNSSNSAEKGKIVVTDMIKAINDISVSNNTIMVQVDESNQKISDIVKVISEIGNKTKVINDIVFQTKLLSFNASVEAARAGEHGKGFAVVAEEVGNLAQMSGNAAKEISSMLDESIQKVEGIVNETKQKVSHLIQDGKSKVEVGSQIAKQCGDVLEEIVSNITQVTQMANEISTACQEQSQGVQEITKAMNQLDQVTQTNASTSEEAASSAEELAAQADALKSVVGTLIKTIKGENASARDVIAQGQASPVTHKPTQHKVHAQNVVQMKPHKAKKPVGQTQSFKRASGDGSSVPAENDPRFEEV